MILIIDNYDSFVFNLARYFRLLGYKTQIARNDAISLEQIMQLNPSHIVISPGPCTPNEAGISVDIVSCLHTKFPIFGVCLGVQVIGQAFGAEVIPAKHPMHGMSSLIRHMQDDIFTGIPSPFRVGRYHSLIVNMDKHSYTALPLKVLAYSQEDEIMALRHSQFPTIGVQFHPESILTDYGMEIISNFLALI